MTKFALGIDIGGTFTDIVLQERAGARRHVHKILTTKTDPAHAAIEGLTHLLSEARVDAADIERVVHATTLFTNALIERQGATTGLLTTAGFGDLLKIGRERKYDLYDLFQKKPSPLVPGARRKEIDERMSAHGDVERSPNMEDVQVAVESLVAEGAESVAVAFLHSYTNPENEQRVASWIRATYPDLFVSRSSEVSPLVREYDRLSTTVANAYIGPLAQTYLDDLADRLEGMGVTAPFFTMASNGGVNSVAEAKRTPVQLLESGPAAGALAGAHFGEQEGVAQLLAFDMGGTTAKMSIIDHGEPVIAHTFEAAREKRFREGSGLPISISTVELIEIGAGGGSIAEVDNMGLIKVGPRSAGAQPGPVCYGGGGTEPTVTDGSLAAGLLNPDYFLGGAMRIDDEAAGRSLERLGQHAGLGGEAAAAGIREVVNESMASAARVHTAERAYDARRCVLLATGGAGPLHAYPIARKLGINTIICPPYAGVGSAIGLLTAPARADRSTTFASPLAEVDLARLEQSYLTLVDEAYRTVGEAGGDLEHASVRRQADMRYIGQGFELTVPLPGEAPLDRTLLRTEFEGAYEASFARLLPEADVEIVNLRVTVLGPTGPRTGGGDPEDGVADRPLSSAIKGRRRVRLEDGEAVETPTYDRYALPVEMEVPGPAVVEEAETTIFVGKEGRLVRRANDNIVIEID